MRCEMIATRDLIHAPLASRGSHCVCGKVREYRGHQTVHQAPELIPLPTARSPVDSTFLFPTRGHPLLHSPPCEFGFLKLSSLRATPPTGSHTADGRPVPTPTLPAPWLDLAPFPCARLKAFLKKSCLQFRDKQWICVFFTRLLLLYFKLLLERKLRDDQS